MSASLARRDLAILAFEARGMPAGGSKDEAIREDLGLTPARYYQLLGRLLDSPAALAHDPQLVWRLRRLRECRRARHAEQESVLREQHTPARR